MGRIHLSQLELLEDLPSKVSGIKLNSDRWHSRWSEYHPTDGVYPRKRVTRIIDNNIGKPFADAFSYYCRQVPKYQQHFFLEEFSKTYWGHRFGAWYYIDDDGNIQIRKTEKRYKGPYTFYSIDAEFERRHKVTGKKEPKYTWIDKKYKESDYHSVLVKGWTMTFESKNDRTYKRLVSDKQKILNKAYKEKYSKPSLTDEEFRKILKAKELKERQENLIKIQSHGFDPVTSFRQ